MYAFFGAQPLLVSGVTGPITVFNKVIFDIFVDRADFPDYLQFMGWVYLWGAILHIISAFWGGEFSFALHTPPSGVCAD